MVCMKVCFKCFYFCVNRSEVCGRESSLVSLVSLSTLKAMCVCVFGGVTGMFSWTQWLFHHLFAFLFFIIPSLPANLFKTHTRPIRDLFTKSITICNRTQFRVMEQVRGQLEAIFIINTCIKCISYCYCLWNRASLVLHPLNLRSEWCHWSKVSQELRVRVLLSCQEVTTHTLTCSVSSSVQAAVHVLGWK